MDNCIHPLGPEWLDYIYNNQSMYPESMRNERIDYQSFPDGYRWGFFTDVGANKLAGWILFSNETSNTVYCEDVAVVHAWQHHGIMKALTSHAYRELRWLAKDIRMHCRKASYPSPAFLLRHGYGILSDKLIYDHYITEYELEADQILPGVDYNAHELVLRPIGT